MSTQGVMFDDAQHLYQPMLAFQFGDATPTLHLFSSDDTPTAGSSPTSLTELSNDSYAPLPLQSGQWNNEPSPPPGGYAILGAAWDLAPPGPFGDTVAFGWWMDAFSPRAGQTFGMYGGRFATPILIPPAGVTITIDELFLALHDCGTSPPPPPPPAPYLRDFFAGVNGTLLGTHTMDAGSGWSARAGVSQLELASGTAVASANGTCADTTDCGAADYVWRQTYRHQSDTQCVLLFRYLDTSNFHYVKLDGTFARIDVVVAGVDTNRAVATFALSPGTDYDIVLIVEGSAITCVVDATQSVTFLAMTNFLSSTILGLELQASGASIPTGVFSRLRVDDI